MLGEVARLHDVRERRGRPRNEGRTIARQEASHKGGSKLQHDQGILIGNHSCRWSEGKIAKTEKSKNDSGGREKGKTDTAPR